MYSPAPIRSEKSIAWNTWLILLWRIPSSIEAIFKINESLVMGAGIAAGGFASNLAGGYNQGAYPQAAPSADPGSGGDSSLAEEKSKQKTALVDFLC